MNSNLSIFPRIDRGFFTIIGLLVLLMFCRFSYATTASQVYEHYAHYKLPLETTNVILAPNSFHDFRITTQVHANNGQLDIRQQDFVFPLRGNLYLPFDRIYTPQLSDQSVKGANWRWAFEIKIDQINERQLKLLDIDGQIYVFNKTNENEFVNQVFGLRSIVKTNRGYQYEFKQNTYSFNETGNLIAIEDVSSNLVKFLYQDGVLKSIDLYGWKKIEFEYDSQNLLSNILLPTGKTLQYIHDSGLLLNVTDERGNTIKYQYQGNVLSSITKNDKALVQLKYRQEQGSKRYLLNFFKNHDIEYTFTLKDNDYVFTTNKYTKDQSQITEYACRYGECIITDPLDSKSRIIWHTLYSNLPERYQSAQEREIKWQYNQHGKLESKQRGNNSLVRFKYNDQKQLTSVISARGLSTEFEYTANGLVSQVTKGGVITNKLTYNKVGELKSVSDKRDQSITLAYDEYSMPVTLQSDLANLKFEYDEYFRYSKLDVNELVVSQLTYNQAEKAIEYKNLTTGLTDRIIYSDIDVPVEISTSDKQMLTVNYDANTNSKVIENNQNQKTVFYYDDFERLSQYDAHTGESYSFSYNALDQLLTIENEFNNPLKSFTYDQDGFLNSIQTGALKTVQYKFDQTGRNKSVSYDDQTVISILYNADDFPVKLTRLGHEIEYFRNQLNQIQQMRIKSHESDESRDYEFTWNKADQLASIIYPGGLEVHYNYDSYHRLAEVVIDGRSLMKFDYQDIGQFKLNYGNGLTAKFRKNHLNKYTYIRHSNNNELLEINNYFDSNRQLISKQIKRNAESFGTLSSQAKHRFPREHINSDIDNSVYVFNSTNRITRVIKNKKQLKEFRFDEFNRLKFIQDGKNTNTVNYQNNQLTGTKNQTFEYTADNQLLKINGPSSKLELIYTETNQVDSISLDSSLNTDYRYDGNGQVILRQADGKHEFFDSFGAIRLSKYDSTKQRNFIYSPDFKIPLAFVDHDGQDQGNTKNAYLLHFDEHLSPLLISDSQGKIKNYYNYDPLGSIFEAVESIDNDIGYRGGIIDKNSEFYLFNDLLYSAPLGWYFNKQVTLDYLHTKEKDNATKPLNVIQDSFNLGCFQTTNTFVSADHLTFRDFINPFFIANKMLNVTFASQFSDADDSADILNQTLEKMFEDRIIRDVDSILELSYTTPGFKADGNQLNEFISVSVDQLISKSADVVNSTHVIGNQSFNMEDESDTVKKQINKSSLDTNKSEMTKTKQQKRTESEPETKRIWLNSSAE